jgi:hypothetical protein
VSTTNFGASGLVFDDFDQLYTEILFTDLLEQVKGYEFKFPDAENELKNMARGLTNPDKRTRALLDYINLIDNQTIITVQKLTADVFNHEDEARSHLQKISHVFRRNGCMKEIRDGYKMAMKVRVDSKKTKCPDRLKGVEFLLQLIEKQFPNLIFFFQKLNNFDAAFEALVATCLELPPLNMKQKFLRHYAEIYIALEKVSDCSRKTSNIYNCAEKVKPY